MTDSRPGARGTYVSEADPLYKALDVYEDAANAVGAQTITTQGAYRQLTDAISGHGDLEEARTRFALEATVLGVQHGTWTEAARVLMIEVAEGSRWQARFTPKGESGFIPAELVDRALAEVANETPLPFEAQSDLCVCDHPRNVHVAFGRSTWLRCEKIDCPCARFALPQRHPDNVAFDEATAARERADEDAAATRAYYGG